jgi:hypothetical protein
MTCVSDVTQASQRSCIDERWGNECNSIFHMVVNIREIVADKHSNANSNPRTCEVSRGCAV